MKLNPVRFAFLLAVALSAAPVLAAEPDTLGNLLANGDFAALNGERPAAWAVVDKGEKVSVEQTDRGQALRVEVMQDKGKSLGEIRQTVKVAQNRKYRLTADIKAAKPGMALMWVKTRAKRKELQRLPTEVSTLEWKTVSKDFDTAEADEVQVLCRYTLDADSVGGTAYFANVRLLPLDDAGNPVAVTTPAPPAAKPAVQQVVAAAGTDQYVLPQAAGDGSGKDFANARGADAVQAALDAAGPGNTVHIGSGTYPRLSLKFASGGAGAESRKRLVGVDTGAGLPIATSNFDPKNPAKTGTTFLALAAGVSHVEIRDIILRDYRAGIVLNGGANTGVVIQNVDVTNCRDAFIFDAEGIRDLLVKDCDVNNYTKRAVRITDGVSDSSFVNVKADAGGKAYAHEVFPVGFHIVKGQRITFTDCVSNNNWHDAGDKYWNADGFAAERGSSDLTFIRCYATGNTDGGWDLKTNGAKLIDCIAIHNKRNFRFWANPQPTILENCVAAFAHDFGNRGHDLGVWQQGGGKIELVRSTIWQNRVSISVENGTEDKPTQLKLDHTLVVPAPGGVAMRLTPGVKEEVVGSLIVTDSAAAEQVRLKSPAIDWRGGDDAFDAVSHPELGYRAAQANR